MEVELFTTNLTAHTCATTGQRRSAYREFYDFRLRNHSNSVINTLVKKQLKDNSYRHKIIYLRKKQLKDNFIHPKNIKFSKF